MGFARAEAGGSEEGIDGLDGRKSGRLTGLPELNHVPRLDSFFELVSRSPEGSTSLCEKRLGDCHAPGGAVATVLIKENSGVLGENGDRLK